MVRMLWSMAKDAAKDAAQRARDMLLGDRIPAIENLAAAHKEVDKIDERIERERSARADAVQTVRTRYEEAQQVGWSTRELRQLGFSPPRAPKQQRRTATASRSSDATQPADAVSGEGERDTRTHETENAAAPSDSVSGDSSQEGDTS